MVNRVGSVSQFGEVAIVGYLKNRTSIRARYPTRRLLGFSPEDEKAKGQAVFRAQRIEFDAAWTDVMQAFMASRRCRWENWRRRSTCLPITVPRSG